MKKLLFAGFVAGLSLATPAAVADADDKAVCLDAASKGQSLRDDHRLLEAREQLRVCAAAGCPAAIQTDCVGWLAEVEKALPSVVVTAKHGSGADFVDVSVTVDGQPFLSKLDGQAVSMNAGTHAFHFEGQDGTSADQQVVVMEGEKSQPIAIVLGKSLAASVPPPTAPSSPPSSGGLGTSKVLGLVVGGTGTAGVVLGSAFGLLTASAISQQKSDCASASVCPHPQQAVNDHSNWTADSAISTAAFVAGGALLAGGAVLFFLPHHATEPHATTGLVLTPSVARRGGAVLLTGEF
jgi:hypothetical protein